MSPRSSGTSTSTAASLDLFGADTSSNSANYFAAGLKGRFQEDQRPDDHRFHGDVRTVPAVADTTIVAREVPALTALNATLRDDYLADCQKGIDRWNRTLAAVGMALHLPHVGFNRSVGEFRAGTSPPTAGSSIRPSGSVPYGVPADRGR